MIFLDFIWLFIFMVLIDSRPMLKSMHNENNGRISKTLSNNQFYPYKEKLKRKLLNEEIDLAKFQKFFNAPRHMNQYDKWQKPYIQNGNIANVLDTLTTEIGSLKRLYGLNNELAMTTDMTDFGTQERKQETSALSSIAEIEAALNDIKQRSIQLMIQQIPHATEIVTSAVTEATFDVKSILSISDCKPRYKKALEAQNIKSLKNEAVTFAQNLENILQDKLKKTYGKIKHKFSSDLKKEINETRSTIKSQLDKISKSKHRHKIKKVKCNRTLATKPFVKKQKKTFTKNFDTKIHSIPIVTDDYSMLSMYEQLLLNSQDNQEDNNFATSILPNHDAIHTKYLSKRNLEEKDSLKKINKTNHKVNQDNENAYLVDYSEEEFPSSVTIDSSKNLSTDQYNASTMTNDISIEALSNKLSYNDYVNGYKYYLNFQRDQENENFSNLVRYQAHLHHNVDDVGKYILNKIPQLPSTRYRRYFFEQDTIEDQDMSTKSDDSWFKKHFYFFIDKDPPKKFHTAQTVSLKSFPNKTASNVSFSSTTNVATLKYVSKSKRAIDKDIYFSESNSRRSPKDLFESNNVKNKYVNMKNTGYVDVSLVHRPSNSEKIGRKKTKNKVNFFNKLIFRRKHPNSNKKRDALYRKTRFNPFKGLKDMFIYRADSDNPMSKVFDYEVITTTPFSSMNYHQLPKMEDMLGQVPNITGVVSEAPLELDKDEYYTGSGLAAGKYITNYGFYKNRQKDDYVLNKDTQSFGSQVEPLDLSFKYKKYENNDYFKYMDHNKKLDDIINVRIKTDVPVLDLWNITLPTYTTKYLHNLNNEIDTLGESISYLGALPSRFDDLTGSDFPEKFNNEHDGIYLSTLIPQTIDLTKIYQQYYHDIPTKLNEPAENFGDKRKVTKINKHNHKKTKDSQSVTYKHLTTSKVTNKNCGLHNVKLYKNGVTTDSFWQRSSDDLSESYSSLRFKNTKDSQLVSQTNLWTPNKNHFNNDEEIPALINKLEHRKTLDDYLAVTQRLNTMSNLPGSFVQYTQVKNNCHDNNKQDFRRLKKQKHSTEHNIITRKHTNYLKTGISTSKNKNKNVGTSSNANCKSAQSEKLHSWDNKAKHKTKPKAHLIHHGLQKGPMTQLHKVPQQYFATPLPMESNNFDRFLKDHKMDVQSVTAPLSDSITSKKNPLKTNTPQSSNTLECHPKQTFQRKNIFNLQKIRQEFEQRQKREDSSTLKGISSTFTRRYIDESTKRSKSNLVLGNNVAIKKSYKKKRDSKEHQTFTAKDVAALEIVIDLRKNNQAYNERESLSVGTERSDVSLSSLSGEKQKSITNSIQVHIALPGAGESKKRSPESVQVRKVFSAKLASPVDLEYQIHSFENETSSSTTVKEDKLSPGVYLILENANLSDPTGQLVLKPLTVIKKSELGLRETEKQVPNLYVSQSYTNILPTKIELSTLQSTKHKSKRYISWDDVKKFFGHDRVCYCRCKANETMCKPCAASDVVISELVFEFNNIAKYMQDHCTEIQTFFWMNPTGGKKLREVVNRIDRSLSDYYKRVKGKCKGRTCKMFSSGIDKRRSRALGKYNTENNTTSLFKNLSRLADDLQCARNLGLVNENIENHARNLLNIINNCMAQTLTKRSNVEKNKQGKELRSIYSLDNVNVNLICSPQQRTTFSSETYETTSLYSNYPTIDSHTLHTYDFENPKYTMVEQSTRKSVGNFFKRRFHSKKNKQITNVSFKKMYLKNMLNFEHSTFMPEGNKFFWQDSLQKSVKQKRSKRKISNIAKPIVKVLIKGGSPNNIKSSTESYFHKESKTGLRGGELPNTEIINLNQLFKKTNDITQNISIVDNMNALFNLMGSNEYDSYTRKMNLLKTKRKKTRNKVTTKEHQLLIDSNEAAFTTKRFLHSKKPSKDIDVISRLRNVTRHFLDKINGKKYTPPMESNEPDQSRSGRNTRFNIRKITTHKHNFELNKSDVITSMTTRDSPTIIIIDDYGYSKDFNSPTTKTDEENEISQNENMRSLLLSVLNFNSKVLNNEWVKASKGKYADSFSDINNFPSTTSIPQVSSDYYTTRTNYLDKPKTMTAKRCLIDKLAHKLSWHSAHSKKMKETHRAKTTKSSPNKTSTTQHPNKEAKTKKHNTVTEPTQKTTKTFTKTSGTKTTSKSTEKIDKKIKIVCDIPSTIAHVVNAQKTLNRSNYDNYVKNVACYTYKTVPAHFLIKYNKNNVWKKKERRKVCMKVARNKPPLWRQFVNNKKTLWRDYATIGLDDDYETHEEKPPLKEYMTNYKSRQEYDETYAYNLEDGSQDFEPYSKGLNGIYEPITRRKRNIGMTELKNSLTNLPPLTPLTDEEFVMIGDTLAKDCSTSEQSNRNDSRYCWTSDRNGMLSTGNVLTNGSRILIKNVQKINHGTYFCYRHNVLARSVKVNVIDVANFNIVFAPVYRAVSSSCTYNDLRAVRELGSIMGQYLCGNYCSVRVDEPTCLIDRTDNSSLLRAVAITMFTAPLRADCSAQCRRDLKCAFGLLLAKNAPILASVPVIMIHNQGTLEEEIKIWDPTYQSEKFLVTHSLRRKDTDGHNEYHALASRMDPSSVHVIILCPEGFFLVPSQKICSVCPAGTYSSEGDNVCFPCPQGWASEPGSPCHISLQRLRRASWRWTPCILMMVVVSVSWFVCYIAMRRLIQSIQECIRNKSTTANKGKPARNGAEYESASSRCMSPSRVILNRLLQVSSAPHKTDSRESRRKNWKPKTRPPLPPIDFES